MSCKIFYRLSPQLLEKIIFQVDESIDTLKLKIGTDPDDIIDARDELVDLLCCYLKFNFVTTRMISVILKYFIKSDLEKIKDNHYNYNKLLFYIK